MKPNGITLSISISLLAHLFLLILWFILSLRITPILNPDSSKKIRIKLIPEQASTAIQKVPQPPIIVDSKHSVPTDKPPENTPVESDKSTQAQSSVKGSLENSALPAIDGSREKSLSLVDQTHNLNQPSPPPQPVQPPTPENAPPVTEPSPDPTPDTPSPETPVPSQPSPFKVNPQLQPQKQPSPQPQQTTPQTFKPSSPFQPLTETKAKRDGSNFLPSDQTSIGARYTDFAMYRQRLRQFVGSQWHFLVEQRRSTLPISSVTIQFYISADGNVENITCVENEHQRELLSVSRLAISAIRGNKDEFKFTDELKEDLRARGFETDGFWEMYSFTIFPGY